MPRERLPRVLFKDTDRPLNDNGAEGRIRSRREVDGILWTVVVRDHIPNVCAHAEMAIEPGGSGLCWVVTGYCAIG